MASKKFETLDGLSSTGDVIISGNVAIDTDTLYVDSVNNRVGIGKTNPSTLLDVDGNITATNVNATFHGDGSNVTSVNATALGGLSNTQFLRSDTSDSFTSGTLTLSGSAVSVTSGNLRIANNIPLRFGSSDTPGVNMTFSPNELQVNGSNVDFDAGTLFVDTGNNRVGVGKTNPSSRLDVNGTVTAIAFTGDSTIVRTTREINTSGIATGGGNLSANRTINVPGTNLGTTATSTARTVTSSTGSNVALPAANSTQAGVMTSANWTKLDGIDAGAEVNDPTNLGNVANSTVLQVTSSTGTNTNLPGASGSAWGIVTTGSQTFAGTKTFNNTISGSINGNANTATTANALNTSNNYRVNSLGVGTNASGTTGEILATNNITAFASDARLKTFTGKIQSPLEKINMLNGYHFVMNDLAESFGYSSDVKYVGVSAQEVEKVLPEIVSLAPFDTDFDENGNKYSKSGENYKTVDYSKLVVLLIEGMKEQSERIRKLEKLLEK